MSNKALTWAFGLSIKSGPKFVLIALADYADESDSCYPSVAKISSKTGIADKTVRNHLNALEHFGIFTRERQRYDDGNLGSYRFKLCLQIDNGDIEGTVLEIKKAKSRGKSFIKKEPQAKLASSQNHRLNRDEPQAKSGRTSVLNLPNNNHHNNHHKEPSVDELSFKEIWEAYNHRLPKSRQGGKDKAFQSFKRQAKAHGMENVVRGLHSYYTDPQQSKSKYEFASGIGVAIRQEKFIGYISASDESKKLYRNMEQARVYAVALAKGRWENQWGAPDDIVKKLASKLQEHSA